MHILRIYSDKNGMSHFDYNYKLELKKVLELMKITYASNIIPAKNFRINMFEGEGWYSPPCPLYAILLEGEVELESGAGEKQVIYEGNIVFAEDAFGKGHRACTLNNQLAKSLQIFLE